MDWRRSAANTKTRGEWGSPCLTPILQWMFSPRTPFSRTEEVLELRIDFIQLIQFWPKPRLTIIWMIAVCSILSNAFSKFNLMITCSFLDLWQICRYSRAQARQSCIVLFLMKPYWFLCTMPLWLLVDFAFWPQDLGDDLHWRVQKRDGHVVIYSWRTLSFRYQGNKWVVNTSCANVVWTKASHK